MRLLQLKDNDNFSLTKDIVNNKLHYAILSHTWGCDDEEVNFQDLIEGSGNTKAGYRKLQFCGQQAARDGLEYFWVDTCCIDKSNNTELSEAINSMFRWYRDAAKCYVYLSDVSISGNNQVDTSLQSWQSVLQKSRWFTRGWTLQELIAPQSVEFFCANGNRLGDKKSLERELHQITGISVLALQGTPLCAFGIKERMSWATNRETKREEDRAYSLLGIFDVHMPLIYGEGATNAFGRFQEEVDKRLRKHQLNELSTGIEAASDSIKRLKPIHSQSYSVPFSHKPNSLDPKPLLCSEDSMRGKQKLYYSFIPMECDWRLMIEYSIRD